MRRGIGARARAGKGRRGGRRARNLKLAVDMVPAVEGVPVKLPASLEAGNHTGANFSASDQQVPVRQASRSMLSRKFSWLQRAPSHAEPAQRPAEPGTASGDAEGEAGLRQSLGGPSGEAQPGSAEATSLHEPHSGTEPGRPGGFKSMLRFGRRSFHWGSSPKDSPKRLADPSAALVSGGGSSDAKEASEGNTHASGT